MPEDRRTDEELADQSGALLESIRELRDLERERRREPRSSEEFHDLSQRVEAKARQVFQQASTARGDSEEDSPDRHERDEEYPGDWTRSQQN